jgi:serine/threonine-protein kinase
VIADTYVIDGLLGEGAAGRVYRAHHRTLANQRYAIKVLIGDFAASSTMRQRFVREAESASRLEHPNIVGVIDYGCTERGLHYLVMDLVDGVSLASLIAQGPMPAERVIRIAHQLCEGLEHAHGRGVIHRDFKPDNVLIASAAGREIARIIDFGLAMSIGSDTRLTTNGVACTPAYAAPEQLRGGAIDHRVDLYGLGATMFEMLSGGYLPFEGDLDTSVAAKLTRAAPSILTRAAHVPPGLVTLIGRLLAHEPTDRPRSALAVIKALETALTLPRPPIRTIDMRPVAARAKRRRRITAALVGIALALALAFALEHDSVPAPWSPGPTPAAR